MVAYHSSSSRRSRVRQGYKEVQGKWGSKADGLNTQRSGGEGGREQCWEVEMCALGAIACGWEKK